MDSCFTAKGCLIRKRQKKAMLSTHIASPVVSNVPTVAEMLVHPGAIMKCQNE